MNINEIAKLAGVSRATISRYLNNGYVSEEKREKIRQIIEETGYQPSSQAQMLRTKKTKLVGVILPKINSDSISRMVSGISEVLAKNNYQLLLANTNNDTAEELKYLTLFRDNQVDGVIFMATILTPKHKKLLKEYKVPIVILGQRLAGYSCVYNDDYHAFYDITARVLPNSRKPAFIGVTVKDEAVGRNRQMGFRDAVRNAHLTLKEDQIVEADFSVTSGYQKVQTLLRHVPDVDTIVCATDNIAIGAMTYLKEIGKRIPEDIQITGAGDSQIGQLVTPPVSSIHFYYKTCGREAASMLIEVMDSRETIKKELKIGYHVIINKSAR